MVSAWDFSFVRNSEVSARRELTVYRTSVSVTFFDNLDVRTRASRFPAIFDVRCFLCRESLELTRKQTKQSIEASRLLLKDKAIKSKEERERRQRQRDRKNLTQFTEERKRVNMGLF